MVGCVVVVGGWVGVWLSESERSRVVVGGFVGEEQKVEEDIVARI